MDVVVQSREAIRAGSKSFAAAALLFAPSVRDDAVMLYAWCRHCDDRIDGQELGHGGRAPDRGEAAAALASLMRQTAAALAGEPQREPAFEALARVVRRHAIAPMHAMDLLEGFGMDVAGRRYRTIDDTLSYCYHVAGTVGVMMASIMGARGTEVLNRAADLGIAFQLTNIARDVADDAGMGRVYLPEAWLESEGLSREDVGRPESWPAVARIVERLLDTAEPYYASGRIGLRGLPFRSAWAVAAARGIYRAIGSRVRRRGANAWHTRVSTGRLTKLLWVAWGGAQAAGACSVGRRMFDPPRHDLWTRSRSGIEGSRN